MVASHRILAQFTLLFVLWCAPLTAIAHADESEYYRIVSVVVAKSNADSRAENWNPPPDDLALEVSGIAVLDDKSIAVAIRKGEVWFLDGVYDDPPTKIKYHRFANALHEPLGLLRIGDTFYSAQRSELTAMRDTDGDRVADEYRTVAKGWGVTGHYHEYAFGPKLDGEGNLWLTLNIGMGLADKQLERVVPDAPFNYKQGRWRGWAMQVKPDGELIPVAAGLRSPSGIGSNATGDMFYTDQQGNWVATNSLHHLRPGAFYHHAESLASMNLPGSTIHDVAEVPDGLPLADTIRRMPQLKPPAVWFPYKKMGQSTTDIVLDASDGKFGPFHGQLFIGEFTQAAMQRVFLEKVGGEYQGACFPFRHGFASAVLRLAQGTDGSMFVGLTNRGWSSLGSASHGLQRLVWTGKTPFEIREMRAKPTGFELVFTKPVDRPSASRTESYSMRSYSYLFQSNYGSDEIQPQDLTVRAATVSEDGLRVELQVAGLRELFVHELVAQGVRDADQRQPLLHTEAYYTLNRIPAK